jgi:hypothetical protein
MVYTSFKRRLGSLVDDLAWITIVPHHTTFGVEGIIVEYIRVGKIGACAWNVEYHWNSGCTCNGGGCSERIRRNICTSLRIRC